MVNKFGCRIKSILNIWKIACNQFKQQFAYEIKKVTTCPETGKQLIKIKVIGKGQSITCPAEEIVVDNNFITGFSSIDIRTITYLATCDRYEALLKEEKIKKSYEIIRAKSRGNNKTVQIRHKETNEHRVVSLVDFTDSNLIDELASQDAYYLGYLAGQEQTWKDCVRLKVVSRCDQDIQNE